MVEIVQFPNEGDKAGPCGLCGHPIYHPIHAPPFGRQVSEYVQMSGSDPTVSHAWQKADTSPMTPEAGREIAAADIVGCLKMWDYTRAEADDILRRARNLVKRAETWANPLPSNVKVRPNNPGGSHDPA